MKISLKPDCIGKQDYKLGGIWQTREVSIKELLSLNYLEGKAIATGIFDSSPLEKGESSNRSSERWLFSEVVVVDIDKTNLSKDQLLNEFVLDHCFMITPSSSFTYENPKYHLFFHLDTPVNDENIYKAISTYIASKLPEEEFDRSLTRTAQPLYGTVFVNIKHEKSIDDSLIYLNEDYKAIELNTLLDEIIREPDIEDYIVSKRVELHYQQPLEERERITLEALDYAFKGWQRKDYKEWLAVTIAAYAGASSYIIRDAILNHPDIIWNGNEKRQFKNWWSAFKLKKGYTVGTLFYYARKNGWLQSTDIDLNESETIKFYSEEVYDYLKSLSDLPKRSLIVSNTGSGKTQAVIKLLKEINLDGKAVFFSPSVKLCASLSNTLTSFGVENTLYIEDGKTKDHDTLNNAKVLVTTLQTFAIKLMLKGVKIEDYKYVVIDESDDLIASFARAEVGQNIGHSSHVNRLQSFYGFQALSKLFKYADYVFMLDGTATKISKFVGEKFCPPDKPLEIHTNTFKRQKANIRLLDNLYDAREIVYRTVQTDRTLTVATDTKKEAHLLYEFCIQNDVNEDEIILITSDTSLEPKVTEFFKDVEAGALKYRIIIYNSAMGTGVSITQKVPDMFVQIAYHITPRQNVQIINRFREQSKVYVYCSLGENLFYESVEEKLERLELNLESEYQLTGIQPIEREELTDIIKEVARMSIIDIMQQKRNVREFYIKLLEADGRQVKDFPYTIQSDFKEKFKEIGEILKQQKENIYKNWRSVDPIEDNEYKQLSKEDYAKGRLHKWINSVIPENENLPCDDYRLAELVINYGRYVYLIERWLMPVRVATGSVNELLDKTRSTVTLKLLLSRLELVGLVGLILENTSAEYIIGGRSKNTSKFLREVELRKNIFNSLKGRKRNNFDEIVERSEDKYDAMTKVVKIILESIGLKVHRKPGKRLEDGKRERLLHISNFEEIQELMSYRGVTLERINFNPSFFYDTLENTKAISNKFESFTDDQKASIIGRMESLYMSFEDSVKLEREIFE